MVERILPLMAFVAVGAVASALGVFPDRDRAIATLNRYALYIAFPALVTTGIAQPTAATDSVVLFIGVQAVAYLAIAGLVYAGARLTPASRGDAAAMTTGASFGNVGYLGIPFCAAALGEEAIGSAAAATAVHIVLLMVVGLPLFARAAGGERVGGRQVLARVARQPLVWAPVAGWLLRGAPTSASATMSSVLDPLAASAAPVALTLLGIYLVAHRTDLLRAGRAAIAISVCKLAAFPALAWLLVHGTGLAGSLGEVGSAVIVLQAAMPMGITTFAFAEEFGVGRSVVSAGIMLSSLASVFTLPLWAALVGA